MVKVPIIIFVFYFLINMALEVALDDGCGRNVDSKFETHAKFSYKIDNPRTDVR